MKFIVSRLMCGSLIAVVLCTVARGEVKRRLTIYSNPTGALVKIDDEEIGFTPVSTSFVYYGTRKIQLIRPGFETLTVLQRIRAPWYEWPGIDFFSEHLVPREIRDHRSLNYQLKPAVVVPTDQLLDRAGRLRHNAQSAATAPLPAPPGAAGTPEPVAVPPAIGPPIPFPPAGIPQGP